MLSLWVNCSPKVRFSNADYVRENDQKQFHAHREGTGADWRGLVIAAFTNLRIGLYPPAISLEPRYSAEVSGGGCEVAVFHLLEVTR